MIKLTVLSSESTETMKKQNNQKDEFQQKESTPLLVNKSKTLQHSKLFVSVVSFTKEGCNRFCDLQRTQPR